MRHTPNLMVAALLAATTLLGVSPAQASCTVPNTVTNGQTADATPVMGNFNSLANCVNSIAAGSTNSVQINSGSGLLGGIGPLTNGQVLVGSSGAAPVAANITAGAGINVVNGPGSITISANGGGGALFSGLLSAPPTVAGIGLLNNVGSPTAPTNTPSGIFFNSTTSGFFYTSGVPTPPYSITVLWAMAPANLANPTYSMSLGWTDGAKTQVMNYETNTIYVQQYNSYTSWNANNFSQGMLPRMYWWWKIRDDGTKVYWYDSVDGVNFSLLYSVAKSSGWLGSTGYKYILASPTTGGGGAGTLLSWTQGN